MIPTRSIHNLYHMRYIIEKVGYIPVFGGRPINLAQSKAFGKVNHRYLVAVLKAAVFSLVFRGWITAKHRGICSVVTLWNGFRSPD